MPVSVERCPLAVAARNRLAERLRKRRRKGSSSFARSSHRGGDNDLGVGRAEFGHEAPDVLGAVAEIAVDTSRRSPRDSC